MFCSNCARTDHLNFNFGRALRDGGQTDLRNSPAAEAEMKHRRNDDDKIINNSRYDGSKIGSYEHAQREIE